MHDQRHVMLDLETLGTKPNSVIVSIGACVFSVAHGPGTDFARFYIRVDIQSCVDAGLDVDPQTVLWWLKQSPEALEELTSQEHRFPLRSALEELLGWMEGRFGPGESPLVFGNGPAFDNAILDNALEAVGLKPLPHWTARCHRTAKDMLIMQSGMDRSDARKKLGVELGPIPHHALEDAVRQASELRVLSSGLTPSLPETVA